MLTCSAREIWEYGTMDDKRMACVCPQHLHLTRQIRKQSLPEEALI